MSSSWDIRHVPSYFGVCAESVSMLNTLTPFYNGQSGHLLTEIEDRLGQLEFLRKQVVDEEKKWRESSDTWFQLGKNPSSDKSEILFFGNAVSEASKQCSLYAECFYLIAWRVVDAIRHLNAQLGQKKQRNDEPKGIRRLRNAVIIHPEKPLPVVTRSFTISSDTNGVSMGAIRIDGEREHHDPGFHTNVEEFRDFVSRWASDLKNKIGHPWNDGGNSNT